VRDGGRTRLAEEGDADRLIAGIEYVELRAGLGLGMKE
jgi:hypothetical protein